MNPSLGKLPLSADVVFRKLFEDLDLLTDLLNAVLDLPEGKRIRRLTLSPLNLSGELAGDKEVVFDLRAEAEDGRHFHIEVQVKSQIDYPDRMAFYLCGMFHGQLAIGQGYGELQPVISIHLLYFRLLPDQPQYRQHHHIFELLARDHGFCLTEKLQLHAIEMDKLREEVPLDREGRWLYFLKHGHEMTTAEVESLGDRHLAAAEQRLKMISQDRELRIQYEQRRKAEMDAAALPRGYYLQGKRDGIDEGKKLGLDEGKKLGLDEGKKLGQRVACQTILALCEVLGIEVSAERRAWLERLGLEQLEGLQTRLRQQRTWPEDDRP